MRVIVCLVLLPPDSIDTMSLVWVCRIVDIKISVALKVRSDSHTLKSQFKYLLVVEENWSHVHSIHSNIGQFPSYYIHQSRKNIHCIHCRSNLIAHAVSKSVHDLNHTVLLKYAACEKPLRMSQISRKIEILRSN